MKKGLPLSEVIPAVWPHGIPRGDYGRLLRLIETVGGKEEPEEIEEGEEEEVEGEEVDEEQHAARTESNLDEPEPEDGLSEEARLLYHALQRCGALTTADVTRRTKIKRQDIPDVFLELQRAHYPVQREKPPREPGQMGTIGWTYKIEG